MTVLNTFLKEYNTRVQKVQFNLREYETLGFPGCVFSTDGVHIGWHNCPSTWRSIFAGKEKVPTIAFNVTANHRRFIHGVSAGHPGTRNDKSISWFDDLIQSVRNDPFYKNLQFKLIHKIKLL